MIKPVPSKIRFKYITRIIKAATKDPNKDDLRLFEPIQQLFLKLTGRWRNEIETEVGHAHLCFTC